MSNIIGSKPRTTYNTESVPLEGSVVQIASIPSPIKFHNGDLIIYHSGDHIAFHEPIPVAPDVVYSFKVPRTTYAGEVKDG